MAEENDTKTQAFDPLEPEDDVTIVQEAPNIDLHLSIKNYRGRTRLARLVFISHVCPALHVDALRLGLAEARKQSDAVYFTKIHQRLCELVPEEAERLRQEPWVAETERINKDSIQQLERELQNYPDNSVRESSRIANEELGKIMEKMGHLNAALSAFTQVQCEAVTAKQLFESCRNLVRIHLIRQEWGMARANANKMLIRHESDDTQFEHVDAFVHVINGIAHMRTNKFHGGACHFTQVNRLVPASVYNEFVTPNDIAIYGGLLSLAAMDTVELRTKVLLNTSFRGFLELEPHLRRAITQFVNGRYPACLAALESHRAEYLLDPTLHFVLPTLYQMIRTKCIVQFLKAYSRVSFDSLNAAFAPPGQSMVDELPDLIRSDKLPARINTVARVVESHPSDARAAMQANAIKTAQQFEKDALTRLRLMSLSHADLELKGTTSHGQSLDDGFIDIMMD